MRYRILTYISTPDGDGYTTHATDFKSWAAAIQSWSGQHCSARVMAHALVRMDGSGEVLERKGWAWADPKFRG